ncbi:MAG: hypothetical protein IIA67_04115 [Planctomycetes bacterium]|nr:hypothetical protein [Planctomycetota bacterium]
MERLRPLFLVVVVLALSIFLFASWCGVMKRLGTIQPVLKDGEVSFNIDYGRTNGLLHLTITDVSTGEDMWDVKLAYFSGANLKYGEVPKDFETFNGATNSAKQLFPKTGAPSDLVEGRVYKMYYKWQYDIGISAGSESQKQFFEIRNKKIVFVKNPNPKPPPKKPSER